MKLGREAGLMILLAATLSASAIQPHRFENISLTNSWFGGRSIDLGKPFDADSEEIRVTKNSSNGSNLVDRGRVYVSSDGWARIEGGPPEARFAWIADLAQSRSWLVDLRSNSILYENKGERSGTPAPASPTMTSLPERVAENLGTREIEGMICRGDRHHVRGGTRSHGSVRQTDARRDVAQSTEDFVVETWTAIELGQAIFEKRVSQHEEATSRLVNIRRREQDRSLFRVPGRPIP